MTTIVYQNGVMCSDSRAYAGDRQFIGSKTKAWKLPDGSLLGVSTNVPGFGEVIRDWVFKGCPEDEKPEYPSNGGFSVLRVLADGSVYMMEDHFYPIGPLDAPYFSVGTGREIAMGVFWMGGTCEDAVKAATELDAWSAGPINTLTLGN